MGGDQSKKASDTPSILLQTGKMIDNYPIRLTNKQQAALFEYFMTKSKTTLTWKDIVRSEKITFRKCVDAQIEIQKLYNMQPDIEEWTKYNKVCLEDCKDMELWQPNPFYHFKCHIGDLVLKKEHLSCKVLINGGVTFDMLCHRHGLTPEIMVILKYSPEEWLRLGLSEDYLDTINDKQWKDIFQNLQRNEVKQAIQYIQGQND